MSLEGVGGEGKTVVAFGGKKAKMYEPMSLWDILDRFKGRSHGGKAELARGESNTETP